MSLGELLAKIDFIDLKRASLDYLKPLVAEGQYKEWSDFYTRLEGIPLSELSFDEKLHLAKTALFCLEYGVESRQLNELIAVGLQLKTSLGRTFFHPTFNAFREKKSLSEVILFCSLLEALKTSSEITALEPGAPLKESLGILTALYKQKFEQKYPERPIAEIEADFKRLDHNVRFPIETDELSELLADYTAIAAEKFNMAILTLSQLKAHLQMQADILKANPHSREAKVQLLAGLRDMVRRHFNIFPHDTQLLAVLGILKNPGTLKGRIAQVKTGEGKSTIIALLAAFEALQGRFVDVISSNPYLAARDREKYQTFFESFDIAVSDICIPFPTTDDFRGQILYATSADIKFSIMRDALYNFKLRNSLRGATLEKRKQEVIIIDEVDNLLVDAKGAARMAVRATEDYRWVYEPILAFVRTHSTPVAEEIEQIRDILKRAYDGRYREKAEGFSNEKLTKWLASAREALSFKENTHYIIEKQRVHTAAGYEDITKIVIIDSDTGRKLEGSRWSRGLHEFVELMHGITPSFEAYTAASLSNSFFNGYESIYGFTGTMGGETIRAEVSSTYHLGSFDVPPRIPSKRIDHGLKIFDNEREHYEAIYAVLKTRTTASEACLVLFNTIEHSARFSDFLRSKGLAHQVLNERQQKHEEAVVALAGEACSITVATNVAGRGTDIPVRAKNFHVICADLPKNDRVRDQGYGRTARQGKNGSCETILSAEDPSLLALFTREELFIQRQTLRDDELETLINDAINKKTAQESNKRKNANAIEAICNAKLKDFFARLGKIHEDFDNPTFKASLKLQCESYTGEASTGSLVLDKVWQPLIEYANALLKQKTVTTVNWETFLEEFKTLFIKQKTQRWASFFSDLEDYYHLDPEEAGLKIEAEYAKLLPQLDAYNPSIVLSQLLSAAYRLAPKAADVRAVSVTSCASTFFGAGVSETSQLTRILTKYQDTKLPSLEQALYKAAANGADEDVLRLIMAGANVNYSDPTTQQTAFHQAIKNGHITTAQLLKAARSRMDIKANDNMTAEDYASNSTIQAMRLLSINQTPTERNRLIVNLVVKYESFTTTSIGYDIALRKASAAGDDEGILHLFFYGSSSIINSQDEISAGKKTALHWALEKGHVTTARLLIALGADTSIKDAAGLTAIDYMAASTIPSIKELTKTTHKPVMIGTDDPLLDKYKIGTLPSPEKALLKIAEAGDDEALTSLLAVVEVNIDTQDPANKKTALHYAVQMGYDVIAQILIAAGAKYDIKDASGKTPAEYLNDSSSPEIRSLFNQTLGIGA